MSGSVPSVDLLRSSPEIAAMICDIPSASGQEQLLAGQIEIALRECDHLEVFREENAVIARTHLGRPHRVIIAGHIDTVPVNNNLPTRIENGQLWGRGTVDMKAGVAIALKLAHDLVEPSYDITWIFYDNEEVDASLNGLGRIARLKPELLEADFAILGEPTHGVVEGGCNGTLRVELVASGTRAHSARAWKGDNAIHKLAHALEILKNYHSATEHVDGLDYRESLSAVGITGGVAGNVIPDNAVLTINYRFAPNKTSDQALVYLRELFTGFDFRVVDAAEGARPGLTEPMVQNFVEFVGAPAEPKYGWTDVARFSALGIPALNFGPGDPSLAHADDERVDISEIVSCENALRNWLTS